MGLESGTLLQNEYVPKKDLVNPVTGTYLQDKPCWLHTSLSLIFLWILHSKKKKKKKTHKVHKLKNIL